MFIVSPYNFQGMNPEQQASVLVLSHHHGAAFHASGAKSLDHLQENYINLRFIRRTILLTAEGLHPTVSALTLTTSDPVLLQE